MKRLGFHFYRILSTGLMAFFKVSILLLIVACISPQTSWAQGSAEFTPHCQSQYGMNSQDPEFCPLLGRYLGLASVLDDFGGFNERAIEFESLRSQLIDEIFNPDDFDYYGWRIQLITLQLKNHEREAMDLIATLHAQWNNRYLQNFHLKVRKSNSARRLHSQILWGLLSLPSVVLSFWKGKSPNPRNLRNVGMAALGTGSALIGTLGWDEIEKMAHANTLHEARIPPPPVAFLHQFLESHEGFVNRMDDLHTNREIQASLWGGSAGLFTFLAISSRLASGAATLSKFPLWKTTILSFALSTAIGILLEVTVSGWSERQDAKLTQKDIREEILSLKKRITEARSDKDREKILQLSQGLVSSVMKYRMLKTLDLEKARLNFIENSLKAHEDIQRLKEDLMQESSGNEEALETVYLMEEWIAEPMTWDEQGPQRCENTSGVSPRKLRKKFKKLCQTFKNHRFLLVRFFTSLKNQPHPDIARDRSLQLIESMGIHPLDLHEQIDSSEHLLPYQKESIEKILSDFMKVHSKSDLEEMTDRVSVYTFAQWIKRERRLYREDLERKFRLGRLSENFEEVIVQVGSYLKSLQEPWISMMMVENILENDLHLFYGRRDAVLHATQYAPSPEAPEGIEEEIEREVENP